MRDDHGDAPPEIVIQRLEPSHWERMYGALCHAVQPWQPRAEAPFGASWVRLAPGEATQLHNHHEGETFYIARGAGVIGEAATTAPVAAGDAIYLPPLASHALRNTSETEELVFLAVYWPDARQLRDRIAERAGARSSARGSRVFILPAPPTPNGDFHLGHLSGPYLGADALARFRRLCGDEVFLVTGADDHQTYVVTRSWRDAAPALAVADRFASILDDTLGAARIALTPLLRPHTSALHTATVTRFFRQIHDNGHFTLREVDAPFCEPCGAFRFGGYVEGRCPACGASCDGAICERCSHPNDGIDLIEPRCTRCQAATGARRLRRLYFPMEPHRGWLLEHLDEIAMAPRVRRLCRNLLADRLPDIAVTHPTSWGIPVPVEGLGEQCIDVWLELVAGHIAAAQAAAASGPGPWRSPWHDGDAQIIHCFGFDNSFFYALFLPALLVAHDPATVLPRALISNEFLLLDGEKFSTSRSHAVWARDLIAASCADAVRLYLAWNRPETEPTTFTRADYDRFTAGELVGRWDGWLTALGERIARHAGLAADGAESWSTDHEVFHAHVVSLVERCTASYRLEGFALQDAARTLSELVRITARFGHATQHLAGLPGCEDAVRTSLALELTAARALAVIASPIMPEFAGWLWGALGLSGTAMTWADATVIFPYGVTGQRIEAYFAPRLCPGS